MSFWKRNEKTEDKNEAREVRAAKAPASSAPDDAEVEELLDTVAAMLRTQGEQAIDFAGNTEDEAEPIADRFEAWARHVLVGSEAPSGREGAGGSQRRDWPGLRDFFVGHRRGESEYVNRSLSDLRDTVWVFIQSLGRVVPEDRASDDLIGEQLGRLRESIESNDTEVIKREALSSIGFIERTLSERRERSHAQIESLSSRVQEISSQLTEAREKLEVDALTGLYNRAALDERLEKLAQLAALTGRPPTVFMIDLDHFKWVNDHFGHPAGDHVLRAVSACLRRAFSDREHFVARYGGDEFCAIAQTAGRDEDIELGENAVLAARNLEIQYEDEPLRVGLSIGGARMRTGDTPKDWMERADRALYAAKEQGRDRFALSEEDADD
jgi:diguanylate cyclase (GGDEF)-like protein